MKYIKYKKSIFYIAFIISIILILLSFYFYNEFSIIYVSQQLKIKNNTFLSAKKFFNFTRENILFGAYGYGPIYDFILGPFERGAGYYDQQSNFFVQLCESANIPARMLMLNCQDNISCHTLAEVNIDNKWMLFDLTYGYIFKNKNRFISKSELLKYNNILDSIFYHHYKPEFYTTGKVEYLSNKRKFVYKILKSIFPIWKIVKDQYQDIYLFFSTINKNKKYTFYKKARHYFLYHRYTKSIKYYKKLLQFNEYRYKDRIYFHLAIIYIKQNKNKIAISYLKKILKEYPHSTIKDIVMYFLYLKEKNKQLKKYYLKNSQYFDAMLIRDGSFKAFFTK